MDTLKVFHDLCEKNDIPYWLAFGSLLGAVRHQGQIPWDYDIDVWVPYEMAQKLMEVLDTQLPADYHYSTRFKDKNHYTYTIKIAPACFDTTVIHVDVFWLVGVNPDPKKRQRNLKYQEKITQIMTYRYCPKKYLGIQGRVSAIYNDLQIFKAKLHPQWMLEKWIQRIVETPFTDAEEITALGYPKIYRREYLGEPTHLTLVNGYTFRVPQYPEKLLSTMYENYMEIPPIESRLQEFRSALARIRALAKIEH